MFIPLCHLLCNRLFFKVTGAKAAFKAAGKPMPPLRYKCVNRIPYARGMGSSSAAIIAGLIGGLVLAGHQLPMWGAEELLQLACEIEVRAPGGSSGASLGGAACLPVAAVRHSCVASYGVFIYLFLLEGVFRCGVTPSSSAGVSGVREDWMSGRFGRSIDTVHRWMACKMASAADPPAQPPAIGWKACTN